MNIYFRIGLNKSTGLGHLLRSSRLAESFIKKKCNILFLIDHQINFPFKNKKIIINELYQTNEEFNIAHDYKKFIKITKDNKGIVIVDDYRIEDSWLKKVKEFHHKIIIFDDHFRKINFADIIVNTKPNFLFNNIQTKYKKLNNESKLLLGPKYSLLPQNIKKRNINKKFNVMFYMGGSEDVSVFFNTLDAIKKNHKIFFCKSKFYFVVSSISKKKINILKLKKFKNVEFLIDKFDVLAKYNFIDLFIGSSGMSLYENRYSNIPSVFFEMSKNQKIDINAAELLGHYFFLKKKYLYDSSKLSNFIFLIFKNYKEVKNSLINSKLKIDNKGSDRIVDYVMNNNIKDKNLNNITKSKKKFFKSINLSYINKYLESRNLKDNRLQSIKTKKIDTLDHYIWWFSTNRISYVYNEEDKPIIFSYFDIKHLNNDKYLLSGWFIANNIKKPSFLIICKIIKNHILNAESFAKKNNYTPLAIINKLNKSMIFLIEKCGWNEVQYKVKLTNIKKLFKNKIKNNFIIYEKKI